MSQFIIGIVIFVIAIIIQSKKAKDAKSDLPPTHGENFPFPIPETTQDVEGWGNRKGESMSVEPVKATLKPSSKHQYRPIADEITVRSYDAVAPEIQVLKSEINTEESDDYDFDFDGEKAIIYSEIMKLKYN